MKLDLDWLHGRVVECVNYDPETQIWTLGISGDVRLDILTPWRMLAERRVVLSSRDHGQKYGLPEPVDAVVRATGLIVGRRIERVAVDDASADLRIGLEGAVEVLTFNDSSGWEAWIIRAPQGEYIAQGGGNVAVFPGKRT